MADDNNYNAEADNKGAVLTNPEAFYKPGIDAVSRADNGELLWHSVVVQAYKMLDYSDKFNKAQKLICSYSMKDLIFVARPEIHASLITRIYSPSHHLGFVYFDSMFGGVIITQLEGKDQMYLHDKKAYQMAVAIDFPGNGIYLDTHRYGMNLTNYLFK